MRLIVAVLTLAVIALLVEQWNRPQRVIGDETPPTIHASRTIGNLGGTTMFGSGAGTPSTNTVSIQGTFSSQLASCYSSGNLIYRSDVGWSCATSQTLTNKTIGSDQWPSAAPNAPAILGH
jgi:hypothetical protein